LDVKSSFLKNNSSTLEVNADTLNEQFLDIEQCDLADAITAFSWAQYCYNAALKVGNSILSQSLIDYMD
jgi:flagellar hook-associated protein 3 FlgL